MLGRSRRWREAACFTSRTAPSCHLEPGSLTMFQRAGLLLGLVASTAVAQAPSRAALVARIDSLANAFIADTHTPAVSVAVLRGSDTIVMKGYGDASIELHRAATAATGRKSG